MNQEDFNLFTAAFSIIRAKKGQIGQINSQITQLETIEKQFKGQEKTAGMKDLMKNTENKIKLLRKEVEVLGESIPKFEKVYEKLEKKYFE